MASRNVATVTTPGRPAEVVWYQPRITASAFGDYYATVVAVDGAGNETVVPGLFGCFATRERAVQAAIEYVAELTT